MRAAVYARYSSENQREQSIEDQIRVCKGFAARDGISVLENHIYFDKAQSGSVRSRPGLEALKKAAEDKQFDAVLVDDSSRLCIRPPEGTLTPPCASRSVAPAGSARSAPAKEHFHGEAGQG